MPYSDAAARVTFSMAQGFSGPESALPITTKNTFIEVKGDVGREQPRRRSCPTISFAVACIDGESQLKVNGKAERMKLGGTEPDTPSSTDTCTPCHDDADINFSPASGYSNTPMVRARGSFALGGMSPWSPSAKEEWCDPDFQFARDVMQSTEASEHAQSDYVLGPVLVQEPMPNVNVSFPISTAAECHPFFSPLVRCLLEQVCGQLNSFGKGALVGSVEVTESSHGYMLVARMDRACYETPLRATLLEKAEQALLQAAEKSPNLDVLGYSARPFHLTTYGVGAVVCGSWLLPKADGAPTRHRCPCFFEKNCCALKDCPLLHEAYKVNVWVHIFAA